MSKLGNLVEVTRGRMDSWYNAMTGLGNSLRDKLSATTFIRKSYLSDDLLENLYHGEDMAAKICESLPEEALRKGYFLSVEGDEDLKLAGKIKEYEKKLDFASALEEAAIWSRVFGGAVIYLGIEDGQLESEPVNEENIKEIRFATVLDKRSLTVDSKYDNALEDKKYGQPKTYRINSAIEPNGAGSSVIHESRILRFDGARTSLNRRNQNGGWSESVLEKVHEVLVQFNVGWQGTSHLLQDAAQGKFKIKGLMDMIASNDKETLQSRMELVDMSRSVARAIMLDADGEDFTREAYSFAGIPEVLQAFMLRLSAAARTPVTILMGQSPSGLNATGESDIRIWYDRVQSYQTRQLTPQIERFYNLVFRAKDFDGEAPESWEIHFNRLWQLTDSEQAALEKTVADKDKVYIDAGVLLPEEVAVNRFKARGFSMETQIDMDARQEMLDAELELAKEKAGEDPMENMIPAVPVEAATEKPQGEQDEDL